MAEYGYIRVSTEDQNLARQLVAMHEAGVPERNIYADKQSGKDFDRPEYIKLVRKLRKGDTLYIHSIDRLGRNYDGILDQWRELTKKGVGIVVLDMPILNTSKDRDLTGRLISDIVLQLLSYVAQTEREHIKTRQREGIAAAKARGVRFGRPPTPLPENFHEVCRMWSAGQITGKEAAWRCGWPLSTLRYRAEVEGYAFPTSVPRSKPLPPCWNHVYVQLKRGMITEQTAAERCGMAVSTYRRKLKAWKEVRDG